MERAAGIEEASDPESGGGSFLTLQWLLMMLVYTSATSILS